MDDAEVRLRCLELARPVAIAQGNHHAEAIVDIATVLYHFTQASPVGAQAPEADKPKSKGRPPKVDPFT